MMYPHQMYGSQLGHHSPATPGSMPQLFSSSTPLAGAMPPSGSSSGLGLGLSASGSGLAVPTPIRPCKRSISDDSTDDEMEHKSLQLADSNMEGNCHLMSRKKRRGLIEKRRRDRINNSLHELKRLVPAAFEKQGSAKLEKAEILQLTVDHLRMLHSKGFDAFSFDPHKFATDYHLIGFREAATEVARYLAVHEGIDFQDPLRLRLMTHLHTYSSQRELSLKSCTGWNPSLFTTPMYPPLTTTGGTPTGGSAASSSGTGGVPSSSSTPSTVASGSGSSSHQQQQQLQSSHSSGGNANGSSCDASQLLHNSSGSSSQQQHSYSSGSYSSTGYSSLDGSSMMASGSSGSSSGSQLNGSQQVVNGGSLSKSPSAFTGYSSSPAVLPSTSTALPSAVASSYASYAPYAGAHYFAPTASYMPPMVHSHAHHHSHHAPVPGSNNNGLNGSNGSSSQSSVKHYRPWGTELAY